MRTRSFDIKEDGEEVQRYEYRGLSPEGGKRVPISGNYCRTEDVKEIEKELDELLDRVETAAIRFRFAADWLGGLLCSNGLGKAELICYLRECADEAIGKVRKGKSDVNS